MQGMPVIALVRWSNAITSARSGGKVCFDFIDPDEPSSTQKFKFPFWRVVAIRDDRLIHMGEVGEYSPLHHMPILAYTTL